MLVAGLNGLLDVTGGLWTRFLLVIFFMAVMAVGRRQLLDISSRFADSCESRTRSRPDAPALDSRQWSRRLRRSRRLR